MKRTHLLALAATVLVVILIGIVALHNSGSLSQHQATAAASQTPPPVGTLFTTPLGQQSAADASVTEINANNVNQLQSQAAPFVLYICGSFREACTLQDPIVTQVAAAYAGRVKFFRVDVTHSQALASMFNVSSFWDVPLYYVVTDKNSQPATLSGYLTAVELKSTIDAILAAPTATPTATLGSPTPRPTIDTTVVPVPADGSVTELTEANAAAVLQGATRPTFIYICGDSIRDACALEDALIAQVAHAYAGRVIFYHVDVDKTPQLAMSLQIQSASQMPAHLLFDGTHKPMGATGYLSAKELTGFIEAFLQAGNYSTAGATATATSPSVQATAEATVNSTH